MGGGSNRTPSIPLTPCLSPLNTHPLHLDPSIPPHITLQWDSSPFNPPSFTFHPSPHIPHTPVGSRAFSWIRIRIYLFRIQSRQKWKNKQIFKLLLICLLTVEKIQWNVPLKVKAVGWFFSLFKYKVFKKVCLTCLKYFGSGPDPLGTGTFSWILIRNS